MHKENRQTSTPQPKRNKARNRKDVKIIALFLFLTVLISLAVVYLFIIKKEAGTILDSSKNSIVELVESEVEASEVRTITSTLGFSLTYNNKTIVADGQTTDLTSGSTQITGQEYENDELTTPREYSILRFYSRDGGQENDTGFNMFSTKKPYLTALTNIRKEYFSSKESDPTYAGLSKIDIIIKNQANIKVNADTTASTPEDVTINNLSYKKVIYTTSFGSEDLKTTKQEIAYFTVQNDRPYMFFINNIENNERYIGEIESIIANATFSAPDQTKLGITKPTIVTAATSVTTLPDNTSYVPEKLNKDTLVDVVLKNQPAVVRIGTMRCADVVLTHNSVTTTLKNACNGGIGSGSFISEDGYLATNGHVVSFNEETLLQGYIGLSKDQQEAQERIDEIVKFLKESSVIKESDIALLRQHIASGAMTKEELILLLIKKASEYAELQNDKAIYAIQTSNEPMRLDIDGDRVTFNFSDTIIKASFIAMNFDENNTTGGLTDTTKKSDVAILKTESKGPFPVVTVADFSTLKPGDTLTAIGYPAFVDDGLSTTQKKTVPTVTQGTLQYLDEVDSYKLAYTDVPISGGNSGGPSFNSKGEQIGLNTYGKIPCPDGNCFGDGVVRNAKDLTDLAISSSASFNTKSTVTTTWNEAIEAFLVGNFKGAKKQFEAVEKSYPANYLAASLASLAASKIGTPEDRSSDFETSPILLYLLIGLAGLLVIGITIMLIIVRKHHKTHGTRKDFKQNNNAPNNISTSDFGIQPQSNTSFVPVNNPLPLQNSPVLAAPDAQIPNILLTSSATQTTSSSEQAGVVTPTIQATPLENNPLNPSAELSIPGGMPDQDDIPKPEEIFVPKMKDLSTTTVTSNENNIEFVVPSPQPITGQNTTNASNVMDIIPPRIQNNAPNRLES